MAGLVRGTLRFQGKLFSGEWGSRRGEDTPLGVAWGRWGRKPPTMKDARIKRGGKKKREIDIARRNI